MKDYIPLSQSMNDHESQPQEEHRRFKNHKKTGVLLTTSIACNIVSLLVISALFWSSFQLKSANTSSRTPYASLERDKVIPIGENSPYSAHNLSTVRRLWEDINIDRGMVALPDEFVASHMLPAAQRFPWDKSKRLYFLNGYHNLHCLRAVHISLMEFAHGERQSRRFGHVLHCMDSLRQDIICNADDTPRYTTDDEVPESGVGQGRMCRDWSLMEKWADNYNACYHFTNQTATGYPNVLRYTWCPPDSPYRKDVQRIMGGENLLDLVG